MGEWLLAPLGSLWYVANFAVQIVVWVLADKVVKLDSLRNMEVITLPARRSHQSKGSKRHGFSWYSSVFGLREL